MSRLKIDGTKVNIIEAKTNFIERLEYEKFYKIKDDISKIRKEHATLNQNYFTKNISSKVENISSLLDWTETSASDTKSTVETIDSYVKIILKEHRNTESRVKSLIEHHEIKDPVRLRYMSEIAENLIEQYEKNEQLFQEALKGEISFEDDSKWNLTDEDKKLIVKRSAKYLYEKRNPKEDIDE